MGSARRLVVGAHGRFLRVGGRIAYAQGDMRRSERLLAEAAALFERLQIVTELERNLRLQDSVLKFQTVKIGDGAASVETKPEDVQFEHMEALVDDGSEESIARSLGLEGGRLEERSEQRDGPSELEDDEDDFVPGAAAVAEPEERKSEED